MRINMNMPDSKTISALIDIADAIETLDLNDRHAWKCMAESVSEILSGFPPGKHNFLDGLSICADGMTAISDKRIFQPFKFIGELYEYLNSCIKALSGAKIDEGGMNLLKDSLQRGIDANANETMNGNPPEVEITTIDDAAACLIQLKQGDFRGFTKLKNGFHKICEDNIYHKNINEILEHVVNKIDLILNNDFAKYDTLLAEINQLIDESLVALDNRKTGDNRFYEKGGELKERLSVIDKMPADVDLEMMGEFVSESKDLIANAEEALLSLEVDPDDMDAVGKVFRAFHTIKGTSAFLELNLLSEMAHHAENLLSRVRDHEIRYSGGYADLSLRSLDMLKTLVQLVEEAIGGSALVKPPGYDELLEFLSDPDGAGISDIFDDALSPRIGDILVAQGKVKREELEKVLGESPDHYVGEALVRSNITTIEDVGHALRTQTKIKGTRHTVDSTVRVSTKRLDKLIDMVGEMVIAQSMVAQDEVVTGGQHHLLSKKISQTGKIVRELQDLSMSMRMVPLKPTFQKMARLVRDVARKVGKNANLVTEGEDTEIDRNLVDILSDPLVHMVRNAIDHGIELPDERKKAGKPGVGTVKLSASHSAGNIVVEISDDGKGLDKELILTKAVERNLLEKGKALTDREIYNVIFEPGFSTAQSVTDVSGRGVGMDVVKKNIDTLRGQVEISSERGKGSVFKISLPLTLAIIDGMVVRVGCESYVIPTETIVRSIKSDAQNISNIFNKGRVLTLQEKLIPLFRLSELFDIQDCNTGETQDLIVVVEDDGAQAGIIVDELVGRHQVVIKSLGESLQGIMGISGGAIMPDGKVGLIIDVGGLVRLTYAGAGDGKHTRHVEEIRKAG